MTTPPLTGTRMAKFQEGQILLLTQSEGRHAHMAELGMIEDIEDGPHILNGESTWQKRQNRRMVLQLIG